MNPKQRREIKDWYTDLALGRTIKAEDIERPAGELARREQAPQHTPGQWTQGRLIGDDYYNVNMIYAGEESICAVYEIPQNTRLSEFADKSLRERFRKGMENAALIARAPELAAENARLRSLLAATSRYCDLYCNSMDSAAIEAAHDAMIEAAKEAVK